MKKLLFIFCIVSISGCATLFNGGNEIIDVKTNDGSSVKAQITSGAGTQVMQIPAFVTVPKSCSRMKIEVLEDENHNKSLTELRASMNPWTLFNILLGGLIGITIDAVTGNICRYNKGAVVTLDKKDADVAGHSE